MQDRAKIQLSPIEAGLVTNGELILTKNNILQKAEWLLQELLLLQSTILQANRSFLPVAVLLPGPKISKGENYRGLPYRVLDNPRNFRQEGVFAVRTLFWWGNFFSITLHLSGIYKKMLQEKIADSYLLLKENELYCCIHHSEWEHHFESDNYRMVKGMEKAEFEGHIRDKDFIKLAKKIPLENWAHAPDILAEYFLEMITIAGISSPTGEKALLPGGPIKGFDP